MRIGTLTIEVFVVPAWVLRIEELQKIMAPLLDSIGPYHDFDYRRFEYLRATLKWVAQIETFWKIDRIYNTLRRFLDKYFVFWQATITVSIKEEGG
ncbi:hypothetical protein ES705_25139 [subsurface metagenome]